MKYVDLAHFLPAVFGGYVTMRMVTHPTKSKIRRRLPKIKTKRIDFCPEIRIKIGDKIIHFHHWFNFSILLLSSTFIASTFLDSVYFKGFLTGGIVQGLLLRDRHGHKIYYDKLFDQQVLSLKEKLSH